jgi:glucose/arabinose dehydrogenase
MPSADKGARYASILADFPACIVFPVSLLAAPDAVKVEVLQNRLDHPWSLAFLPDNNGLLVTLRGGQLRHWQAGKGLSDPIIGVPKVWASGQGGLLDVVLAPDFAQSRRVWLSYAEVGHDGKAGTAVGYGRLSDDVSRIEGFQVVFRQMPKLSTGNHFGGRLVFDGKGYLFIGLAKITSARPRRNWTSYRGKWCV